MPSFESMGIQESGGGSKFEELPFGTYVAYGNLLVDLGTQKKEWQGETWDQRQLWFQAIVPDERTTIDGEDLPRSISTFLTFSLGEKGNLWKHVGSWAGGKLSYEQFRSFDFNRLLGKWGMFTIGPNQKNKPKLTNIAPLMKGISEGTVETEPNAFWFSEYQGGELPSFIPKGIANIVMRSPEYAEKNQGGTLGDDADIAMVANAVGGTVIAEDIPF